MTNNEKMDWCHSNREFVFSAALRLCEKMGYGYCRQKQSHAKTQRSPREPRTEGTENTLVIFQRGEPQRSQFLRECLVAAIKGISRKALSASSAQAGAKSAKMSRSFVEEQGYFFRSVGTSAAQS